MTITELRNRRLHNMEIDELQALNGKLSGKGFNWLTKERSEVCKVIGIKMSELFKAN